MSDTPATKTPRDEALDIFESMVSAQERHDCDAAAGNEVSRQTNAMMVSTDAIELARTHAETIRAALSQPAPIVDGEEWECFCDEAYYDQWAVRDKNGDCSFTSAIHVRTKDEAEFLVSRLNAQGQTQSAVPERWKLVPIEPTREMAMKAKDIYCITPEEAKRTYKAMLSAAPTPPVTGGAWRPIETAPKDGTMILLFYSMLYCTPNVQCVGHWTLHNGGSWQQEHGFSSNTPERPTHYQLLSAPPSSAEQTRGEE